MTVHRCTEFLPVLRVEFPFNASGTEVESEGQASKIFEILKKVWYPGI
jgi:hypothetical protein